MSTSTTKSADKIKLLDQMLEDIAGDELEEYKPNEATVSAVLKHYSVRDELALMEIEA